MNRSTRLAAGALMLVSLAACNKRNEVVTNDPMAENDVVSLPTEEVNAVEDENSAANETNVTDNTANAVANNSVAANAAAGALNSQ